MFSSTLLYAPDNKHGIKDCPVLGKIALEKWSTTGLFGMLHGHLHKTAIYDLTQIYSLKIDHPILIYMQVQQLLLAYIIIIQIALIQFQMKEKFSIIGLITI